MTNINSTNMGWQPEASVCQPFNAQEEHKKLKEKVEHLERTLALLRREVYNGKQHNY